MNRLRKWFFETEMTWKRVLLLSVITGVLVGLIMIPDFLDDTSFQNPGVTVEFWILWALFIILNCKKSTEAGLKTFVAFLISQPVIYLVQVPFTWMGWEIFGYYKRWFLITLLTLPGGMIAWYVKKGNALSVAILSVANGILCFMIPEFALRCMDSFPHHLLTILFMLAEIIFFALLLFEKPKMRAAAWIIAAALLIGCSFLSYNNTQSGSSLRMCAEGDGPYELLSEHELFTVEFEDSWVVVQYLSSALKEDGEDTIVYTDCDGTEHEIHLVYGDGNIDDVDPEE